MVRLSPNIYALLLPSKTRSEYDRNIEVLEKNGCIDELCHERKNGPQDELFDSSDNIPRPLESFLIIDFELKRTLICDFLFAIHKNTSMKFSLEKYLYATKRIFSIITQYRWAQEDLSFVLKIIFIYLENHMKLLEKEKVFHILEQFQIYGPWERGELESFFYDNSCLKIFNDSLPTSENKSLTHVKKCGLLVKIMLKFLRN